MSNALFRLVGTDDIVLKRRGLPTVVKGKPVPSVATDVPIKANIQPAGYAELMQLPEGDRSSQHITIMSVSEIREFREGSWEADEFTWDGHLYTVVKVKKYTMRVRNHYQAICARKQLVK